ncbi:chemotaxis protein CheB [Rhodocyclus purpureus]|uniref:chemotaxis protein CheB n=1 Tax=Rhodocyclus purpureus TaxID=1067 RepID=UPI0019126EA3|nr:chemotaxis protein CheB [Rhodocyclus purpureus]MBK5915587.1 chemotaxis protein CheB [Rhodocyclus purpureus]
MPKLIEPPSPQQSRIGTASEPALPAAAAREFPIVGIGCSAGGLEALEKFLIHVPAGSGIAIIIVQHLPPDHVSALPSLLQRFTSMKVVEVVDGMRAEPDVVHIIPPNKDLLLLHGRLRLLAPVAAHGLRLPIDFFLRSLAEERKEKAVGVILSGMGSDGVLGLRAIKEKGGLTLVQDPACVQAANMPLAAVEAGVADIVAPAEELPVRILDSLRRLHRDLQSEPGAKADILSALEKIVILLRDRRGHDFSLYKTNTLVRRVERRMAVNQIASVGDYISHLRSNPHELDLLFNELLIGVTSFFRDPEVWETLRKEAIPALLAQNPSGKDMRAWVAACSTGEEAYSLAIVYKEAVAEMKPEARFTLQIYATDLDQDAIDQARKGSYPENIAAVVSAERLARHFTREEGGGYRINKDIREMVVFARQNIVADPPFTKLDILSCRNLFIYFGPDLQKKLLPLFHYALSPGGLLLLGNAESIGNFGHLFAIADARANLFRRVKATLPVGQLEFPGWMRAPAGLARQVPPAEPPQNIGRLTDQLIQQTWAPAAVLVNAEGDILYFSGRTGKYLEPAAGKTNINIHAMAREGLREAMPGLIRKALKDRQPILINGLRVGADGGTQIVDLVVQAIDKPAALRGRVIIVFKDVPSPTLRRHSAKRIAPDAHEALREELAQVRESLRVTQEEMQTRVEELRSSNEELQSTIEELQSANEELTTAKDELQSRNEELQTANGKLQSKLDDLSWVRNDMANLLNSTEIATVFLDDRMKLRRFTNPATKLFKLIPSDVGRPLSHIVTDLDYPRIIDDAREVLRSLVFQEKVSATHDGCWFRVRIMPYRTLENVIDGVVITFIDITEIKQLESELRKRTMTPAGDEHGPDPS